MVNQKEDSTNFIGTLFFMVLICLLITSFFDKPNHQISFPAQYQLNNELSLSVVKAVAIDFVQMPSVEHSCLQLIYNDTLNLFSETCKIFADNNKITQRFIFLQKSELLIKPLRLSRWFCFQFIPTDNNELPILG